MFTKYWLQLRQLKIKTWPILQLLQQVLGKNLFFTFIFIESNLKIKFHDESNYKWFYIYFTNKQTVSKS